MPTLILKPLIACTTSEDHFSERVESAAHEIGTDFCSSDNLDTVLQQCNNRISCVVIDYKNSVGLDRPLMFNRKRNNRPMIFVVSPGDVRAAFNAASAGAVNVIERPNLSNELIVNLRTALASESRLEEYRQGEHRFTDKLFNELTAREKSILGLLLDGEPNKRVASILDVGLRTVEAERAQVIKKMKASSFVELIRLVSSIENDIVETRKSIFGSIFPHAPSHRV